MKDVSVKSGTPGLSLGSAKNVKRLADMSSAMKAKFDPPKQPELSFDNDSILPSTRKLEFEKLNSNVEAMGNLSKKKNVEMGDDNGGDLPQQLTVDEALTKLNGKPFITPDSDNPPSLNEVQNATDLVNDIEVQNKAAEANMKKLKKEMGLRDKLLKNEDLKKIKDQFNLKNDPPEGFDAKIKKLIALDIEIKNRTIVINKTKNNLKDARKAAVTVKGSDAEVDFDADGNVRVKGSDIEGLDFGEYGWPKGAEGDAKFKRAQDIVNKHVNDGGDPPSVENTPRRKQERAQRAENTQNRVREISPQFRETPDTPIGINRNADGEMELTGVKDINDMPDGNVKKAWKKMTDALGFKSKGMDSPKKVDTVNAKTSKSLKSKFLIGLLLAVVFGFAGALFVNILDCIMDGELGEPQKSFHINNGRCDNIIDVIRGEGGEEDVLNYSQTDSGADIIRKNIKGYVGRNNRKPFMIRHFNTHSIKGTGSKATGTCPNNECPEYYYVHYPENSYGIDRYHVKEEEIKCENTMFTTVCTAGIPSKQLIEANPLPIKCLHLINQYGEILVSDDSHCPTLPPTRSMPEFVDYDDDDQWKNGFEDGEECRLEYEIYQSSLECSLENILAETMRDFGQLAKEVFDGTADALVDAAKTLLNAGGSIFDEIFESIGGPIMIILYVVCGVICLIILYKLYKSFS